MNANRFSVLFNTIAITAIVQCCVLSDFVTGYVGEEEEEQVVIGDVGVPGSNVKGGVSGCHLTTDDPDADCIPGRGGADYPLHWQVPPTHFQCSNQPYPGYYADPEARCQVFHICQSDGRQDSFLCPNGTVFNQKYFTCEWWYNVNCAEAPSLYVFNANLYREPSVSLVQQPGVLRPALPVAVVTPPSVTVVRQPSSLHPAPTLPAILPPAPPPSGAISEQPPGTLPSEPEGY